MQKPYSVNIASINTPEHPVSRFLRVVSQTTDFRGMILDYVSGEFGPKVLYLATAYED